MPHILRSSPPSPFGRKVKLAASLTGFIDEIEVVMTNTTDPEDSIRQQNPLGKIPALILENGVTLYDSRVILEYIDLQAKKAGGKGIIPDEEGARFAALTLQALADGIMDASIIQMYEIRMRPEEKRHSGWVEYQADKVARAMRQLEANINLYPLTEGSIHVGQIATACALGYLDLRFAHLEWRKSHKGLAGWLTEFEALVPMFAKTRVEPS